MMVFANRTQKSSSTRTYFRQSYTDTVMDTPPIRALRLRQIITHAEREMERQLNRKVMELERKC